MIYKSSCNCHSAHFIRKKNWAQIGLEFPYFYKMMKRKSLLLYCNHFRNNINIFKQKEIQKYNERADFGGQVVMLQNDMGDKIKNLINEEFDDPIGLSENEENENLIKEIQ